MNVESRISPHASGPTVTRRSWLNPVGTLVACGAAVTLTVFALAQIWEQRRIQSDVELVASGQAAGIQADIRACQETLYSLRELYAASKSVEAIEFRAVFEAKRPRRPEMRSLRWIAHVRASERAAFEATTRADQNPGFAILDINGTTVPAVSTNDPVAYLPWTFWEPFSNKGATNPAPRIGFDLASIPGWATSLAEARDHDAPVRLIPPAGQLETLGISDSDLIIALPVYWNGRPRNTLEERRASVQGYVTGVFHLPSIISLGIGGLRGSELSFQITTANNALALDHIGAGADYPVDTRPSPHEVQATLDVAGEQWKISYEPTRGFLAEHRQYASWILLLAGLGVTTLIAAYARNLRATAQRIEQTVERRTADLFASEDRFRQVLETLPTAAYMCDADGLITYHNQEARNIWGQAPSLNSSEDRFCGATLIRTLDGKTVPREECAMATALSDRKAIHGLEALIERADGTTRTIVSNINPLWDGTGSFVGAVNVVADITERRQAEAAETERTRLTYLTAEIGRVLNQNLDLQAILQHCCEALVQNAGAAFARVWTLNEETQTLELQSSAGLYTHIDGPHARVPVGKFKIGLIASDRKPHLTNTVVGDPRVGNQEWAIREGMVAFAGYPILTTRGRLLGVLALFAKHKLSEDTLRTL